MSPQPSTAQAKERTNRTTVGLSDETVKNLDALSKREVDRVREAGGIGVAPSRGQIVEALVRNALTTPNGNES